MKGRPKRGSPLRPSSASRPSRSRKRRAPLSRRGTTEGWTARLRSDRMPGAGHPVFEFHIARSARDRYQFAERLFPLTGNVVLADLAAGRDLAHRMNVARDAEHHPELAVSAGALNAMGLIDEVVHLVLA